MQSTASHHADLNGLEIKTDDLLGPPNACYRQPWSGGGASRFMAAQLSRAEAVYDETRRFFCRTWAAPTTLTSA